MNYPDCIAGVNIYGAKSEQYQRLEVTVIYVRIWNQAWRTNLFIETYRNAIDYHLIMQNLFE